MTAPLVFAVLALGGLASAASAAAGGIYWLLRRKKALFWHGRQIQLIEGQLHRELWIDGRRIAWAGPGVDRLAGMIDDPVYGRVPLVWSRAGGLFGLYAAGKRVAGTLDDEVARAESEASVFEPADPRWPSARALLESLSEHTDPATRKATQRIRVGLHDALRHLAALGQTADAHAALGGDSELQTARQALSGEVDRWLEALRALHLQSSIKAGSADDILAKVRAESEVDSAVREKARELAHRTRPGARQVQ